MACFSGVTLQRHEISPPAAFLGVGAMPFVGQKPVQRNEEKCSKLSFFRRDSRKRVSCEQSAKESLSQIFCIVRRVTSTADVGIEWIPISLAKSCQCVPASRRFAVSGSQDDTP